jgi:hypothetical protein
MATELSIDVSSLPIGRKIPSNRIQLTIELPKTKLPESYCMETAPAHSLPVQQQLLETLQSEGESTIIDCSSRDGFE